MHASLLRDPILSFLHAFLPKGARVRGPRPDTGNPGSASAQVFDKPKWSTTYRLICLFADRFVEENCPLVTFNKMRRQIPADDSFSKLDCVNTTERFFDVE